MKENTGVKKEWKYFVFGIGFLLSILLLIGATTPSLNIGRFQISSWATRFNENAGGCGAFIVDTATGNTKTVYSVVYGDPGETHVLVNNLRKPFASIE